MPLQNRVTPSGDITASNARGTLMGNRGILHDDQRRIVRPHKGSLWIHCVLDFNGRQRVPMTPGSYTELFFLDEATALAAGHRPCGECQRDKYRQFKTLMEQVHGRSLSSKEVDKILQQERLGWQKGKRRKQKRLFSAEFASLPTYTMIAHNDTAYLKLDDQLLRWTPFGYEDDGMRLSAESEVAVLTPASIVEILRLGYQPSVHAAGQ